MKKPSFEESLKHLEEVISQLESGSIPLEESLILFEEGVKLSQYCTKKLDEAEKKVQILVKIDEGEKKAVPFELEEGRARNIIIEDA
ncbi:MAG: exodeoxyribonuclease VII small subunit [bacterium]